MNKGNFFCVEFVTGEFSPKFSTKKEAAEYMRASNSYSESRGLGPVSRRVVKFKDWEEVK